MKRIYTFLLALAGICAAQAQIQFDPAIDPAFLSDVVNVPASPLKYQVLFIGSVSEVQTTATYGNPAGTHPAKEWHDFIGFTPDNSGESLGWITVNHEMVIQDDHIGDGGGMTSFRVKRDPVSDTLIVMEQTLSDGRSGKFFAIDFVNTTGETGMNCGGIVGPTGRIWTGEEWYRASNNDIVDRDLSNFVIGTGTVNGQSAPAGFPGFNGDTIEKYQNYNWMVEVDPREAVAIRKQYNWGRQNFEGGVILPDNKTVYLSPDATPAFITKFVADNAGDFTSGTTYIYKHNASPKWVEIDNTDLDKMLDFDNEAVALGATMFNRLEWNALDPITGKVYFAETGRDYPGSAWAGEHASGAVHAPHHVSRAQAQGTDPDSADYKDYYGRILELDPATDNITVYLEGGPDLATSPTLSNYPTNHLSNPDGLGFIQIGNKSYMIIEEDLNGLTYGRMPAGMNTVNCEAYLLDMSIANPTPEDLMRIAVTPVGAEITGAGVTSDGKTLLINVQHPNETNPYPYNHSLTFALTGWDALPAGMFEKPAFEGSEFSIHPNPASRILYFNGVQDVALYDASGKRMRVARQVSSMDIMGLEKGIYFIRNAEGKTKKLVIE